MKFQSFTMKNKSILLLLILFTPFLLRAEWISLNKNKATQTPPNVTLISDDNNSTVIKINISGFELKDLFTEGKTYQSADLLSESFTTKSGFPEVPYISKILAIPDQVNVSYEIIEIGELQTYENIFLPPARESWIEGHPESSYTENLKAYNSMEAYPNELVNLESPSVFRDFRIVRLSVFPLRYIPAKKQLQAISSITVRINYENGKTTNPKISTKKKIVPSFGKLYRSFIFNYQSVLDNLYEGREDGHELMLCIMPDDFVESFQDYASWKRQSGIDIHITKFSDIGANSSDPGIIKDHIADAYYNWDIPPSYVLLVGDAGIIPVYGNYVDENYYVEIEGSDYFPEMLIGRFTNQSDYGMQVMINKFLIYEKTPYTATTDWFKKGICCSNNAYASQVETKRFAADKMMDYGFTSVDTMMNSSPCNYDIDDVINAVNEGRSYLNYRGEGWSSGWWASCTPFNQSHVGNLSNGQKFTFVTSIGCGVAMFDNGGGTCFGEEWIETGSISNPKGGIAFIGPTGNTHTTYNNKIDKGIYTGMFLEGMDTPGQALVRGKLYMYNVFGDTPNVAYHYRIFCILGDPSIHIWKEVPRDINVDYVESIPIGNSLLGFTVTHTSSGQPVSNAVVSVTDDTFFATGYTNEMGIAHVNVFADQPKIFNVTVRGGTAIPFQGELIAIQPSGAYIIEDSYEINDATGGNNNGLLDYGESNMLSLTIKNVGMVQAENVGVTLSTNSPYITLTDSTASYGNIAPGGTVVVPDGFTYSVSNTIPDMEEVSFVVTASTDLDSWISNFSVDAHAPILEYLDYIISDPSGNNNGKLDPGETVNIIIDIENSGSSEAMNILGELTIFDQFVTVNSAQMSFGNIAGGAQANAIFSISADINTPAGYFALLNLSLEADLGISGANELHVIIGQVPVLILNLDENGNSAPEMEAALNNMDITCELMSEFPPDLNLYATIFVCLGIYPENHALSDTEGQTLADYLNNGGSLYMEGGDTWYFDQNTAVHEMFNIYASADGAGDMGTVVGNPGAFTEGMSFSYNGENGWMDHIEAIAPAVKIFDNQSPLYGTGVAYDDGDYKTIGASHEFGGLLDASSPSTKEELMVAYLTFLGVSQTLQAYFSSNITTPCTGDTIEFYDMSVGNVTSWEWNFEGGSPATSSDQNPMVTYFTPGIFDVSLTVYHGITSNTFAIENYITVNATPEAPSAPTGPGSVCADEENTTYTTNGITGITEYKWTLEPSEAGSVSGTGLESTVLWETEFMGDASLTVAAVNECGTGDFSNPINISRYLPEVSLEPFEWVCLNSTPFELSGGLPEGGEYSGSGVENGWFDPAIAGLGTHTITYVYTDFNNCGNFAEETMVVDPCTGINENTRNNEMVIFPNPGKGDFTLRVYKNVEIFKLELFNTLNESVYATDKMLLSKNAVYHLDFNHLPQGIYYLHVFGKGMDQYVKIIIQE